MTVFGANFRTLLDQLEQRRPPEPELRAQAEVHWQAEPGWFGALQVAGDVAYVFTGEDRFWHVVDCCRRGTLKPAVGARHLVPLRANSLSLVRCYIETAIRHLDHRDWAVGTTLAEKRVAIGLDLANLGDSVWRIGEPSPYARTHCPHSQLGDGLERLERLLARRCLECGEKLSSEPVRRTRRNVVPRRLYYCSAHASLERWIARDWKRFRRLLEQAEVVLATGVPLDRERSEQEQAEAHRRRGIGALSRRCQAAPYPDVSHYDAMSAEQLADLPEDEYQRAIRLLIEAAAHGR